MMHEFILLFSHLIALALLTTCCKSRNKTSTNKRNSNASVPTTPLDGAAAQTTPPAIISVPPPTSAPPTTVSNTPSTNPSSGQPVSSSPVKSAERHRREAALKKVSSVVTSSNAEDDMVSQTGKKKKEKEKGSPKQRLPDEEMAKGRPAHKKKVEEGRKKASEKTCDDARNEQKTQEGGELAGPAKDSVNVEPEQKKKSGWFSKFRKKADDSPKATPTTTPTKAEAPRRKLQNWHDVVPESHISDDLTDFDQTKHTQDDKTDFGAADTQSGYEDTRK